MTCDNECMRTPEQRARRAEYQRAYRVRNLERLQEYDRNRMRTLTPEQREASRLRNRAYYAANRDRELAKMREYQVRNRDQISVQKRAYRAANLDKIRARMHTYQKQNGARRRHVAARSGRVRFAAGGWRASSAIARLA